MPFRPPLPSIPQLYRNVRRWTEIASILSKYGLADWLSRINVPIIKNRFRTSDGTNLPRITHEARIRLAMIELGPTFIKLGQLLSTRADIVGLELASELSHLQADVPADRFEDVQAIIEQELERPLHGIFSHFDPVPLASASIGQVHHATLTDGRDVVVKVRHLGIEKVIETDLDILSGLAQLAERLEDLQSYQPVMLVGEMSRTMRRELDFRREQRNLSQFQKILAAEEKVRIPEPVTEFCTERVLVMQYLSGTKLRDLGRLPRPELDFESLASRGANLYLKMIFQHGFYHADPHPGNLVITDDGQIGLLDFGMVGRIGEPLREDIENMLVAIINRDVALLTTIIKRIGACPLDLDESALAAEVADFVGQYATLSLANFDMSGALTDFIAIVRRFRIVLPSEAALLIKVLITLEGTGRLLNPTFSLMEVMRPWHRKLLVQRLSPRRRVRKLRRFYLQVEQLVDMAPRALSNILQQVQTGKFDVHLDHRRLGPTVNRLVLGMMTSALFLGSALMLSYKVPPVLWPETGLAGIRELSILGLSGCIVSLALGFRLYLAIRRSGNLDRE